MKNIILVKNDKLYDINFTITDNLGNIVDLSGSTILFKVANYLSISKLVINGSCTATDAPNGKCKYTVQANDFINVGSYAAQLEITYTGSGKVITAQGINITIVPKLGYN